VLQAVAISSTTGYFRFHRALEAQRYERTLKAGASLFGLLSQPHPVDATLEVMVYSRRRGTLSTKAIQMVHAGRRRTSHRAKPGEAVGATDSRGVLSGRVAGRARSHLLSDRGVRFGLLDGVHGSWRVALGPRCGCT